MMKRIVCCLLVILLVMAGISFAEQEPKRLTNADGYNQNT